MTMYRDPKAWCTRCGGPATARITTVDPAHPIGDCHPSQRGRVGCGRQILTLDGSEADACFDRYRRRNATARHSHHDPIRAPEPYCAHCKAVGRQAGLPFIGTDAPGK